MCVKMTLYCFGKVVYADIEQELLPLMSLIVSTHRDAHNRVAVEGMGVVFDPSCVVIHQQGHNLRHGWEGDICNTVHLLNVHNSFVHLQRERLSWK